MNARGEQLQCVYDETKYIASAIDLVQQNIWIGGFLALSVLLLFFRNLMPTIIVFAAIPISVIGTFVAIAGFAASVACVAHMVVRRVVAVVVFGRRCSPFAYCYMCCILWNLTYC